MLSCSPFCAGRSIRPAGSPLAVARATAQGTMISMDVDEMLEQADAAHQQVIDVGQPQAPVDSTAAGDAFNAAYLGARLADQPATEAARAGHALASWVIGAHGALVALDA